MTVTLWPFGLSMLPIRKANDTCLGLCNSSDLLPIYVFIIYCFQQTIQKLSGLNQQLIVSHDSAG